MFGEFTPEALAEFYAAYAEQADKDAMECNKPRRTPDHPDKKSIVKACEGGKEVIVRFGDQHMRIRKNEPDRKANFRARHNCGEKKSKLTAGYWSCKAW